MADAVQRDLTPGEGAAREEKEQKAERRQFLIQRGRWRSGHRTRGQARGRVR